jgi:DNA-binding Lrp family transcriptional regulator
MSNTQMVKGEDLDDIHRGIIAVMRDGRATPRYLSKEVGESRQLVSNRLRDLQMAGIVTQIDRGLYELNSEEVPGEDE